jgi:hypothetical protein
MCHGQVDKMPLMYQAKSLLMEFCLDCHRGTEKYLRPRDQVFNMGYQAPTWDHPVVAEIGGQQRSFTNQLEMGQALQQEYHVASVEHLTNCSICHR